MEKDYTIRQSRFPVGLVLLMAGAAASLLAATALNLSDLKPFPSTALTGLVIVSGLFCAAVIAYFFLFIWRVLRRWHRAESSFAQSEIGALKASLTELARGNLSVRSEATAAADPVNGAAHSAARGVGGILQPLLNAHLRIIAEIRDSIAEIDQVSAPSCSRLCYVGADSLLEGKKAGLLLGRLLGGTGKAAVMLGSLSSTGQALRRKGFQGALCGEHPGIELVAVLENHESQERAAEQTRALVAAHPDLAGIYVCHGSTPHIVARAAEAAAGLGQIRIVTHDLTPATMECIARGAIAATFSQSAYNQGFDAVVELYNFLVAGAPPLAVRRLTPVEEVNRTNWTRFWDTTRGELMSEAARSALASPLANALGKAHRIGVILPDDTGFWEPVAAGVRGAESLLTERRTTVTVVTDEAIRRTDGSAASFYPLIEKLIAADCEAVCLPVFDPVIIPYLNQKSEQGTVIITYNAEPVSLRGLLDSVSRHAAHLFHMSENLAAHATENTQAVNQITATMKLLLVGSLNQIQHLSRTDDRVQSLVRSIGRVRAETGESIQTARLTTRTARAGYETIRQSQAMMQSLDRNAQVTSHAFRTLNDYVIKIGEITRVIDEIAAQTNLLAINASIQAYQAGAGGKGFSVVAREIRSLAEQAAKATADISELIGAILTGVTRAADSVQTSTAQVSRSVALADQTENVFREITTASIDNEAKVEGILARSEGMLAVSEEVRRAMAELHRLNQENGGAVEEITVSVLEMSKEISELGEAARLLQEMGQSQEDLLSQFRLE